MAERFICSLILGGAPICMAPRPPNTELMVPPSVAMDGASSHQISLQVASSGLFPPCTLPHGALTKGCDARQLSMELVSCCVVGA